MSDAQPTTSADDGKNTGAATTAGTPPAATEERKSFTQPELDAMFKQRADQAAAAERARIEKERAQADEDEQIKRGELESVAEKRRIKLEKLEPEYTALAEQHAKLVEVIREEIKERAKALPAEIRAMMPEGDDVLAQRIWLTKAEKAAKVVEVRSPGTPPGPRGSGGGQVVGTGAGAAIDAKRNDPAYQV